MTDHSPQDRMIGRKELRQRVPFSDVTIWRMEQRGDFPKRITISKTLVCWRESDIQKWIAEKGMEAA